MSGCVCVDVCLLMAQVVTRRGERKSPNSVGNRGKQGGSEMGGKGERRGRTNRVCACVCVTDGPGRDTARPREQTTRRQATCGADNSNSPTKNS